MEHYLDISYEESRDRPVCIRVGSCKICLGMAGVEKLMTDVQELYQKMTNSYFNFIEEVLLEIANPVELTQFEIGNGVIKKYAIDLVKMQRYESIYINGLFIDTENISMIQITPNQLKIYDIDKYGEYDLLAEVFIASLKKHSFKVVPYPFEVTPVDPDTLEKLE